VKIRYHGNSIDQRPSRSLRYELSVAARRIFSELRDEYVHKLYPRRARPAVAQRSSRIDFENSAN